MKKTFLFLLTLTLSILLYSTTFNDINAGLQGVGAGSVVWGDYDNDGDLDGLLIGPTSRIYHNNVGLFTEINAVLPSGNDFSADWGDYDNDNDLDLALAGTNPTKIFRNDNGVFTDIGANLLGFEQGSIKWGDYDNDGDLDILISGSINVGASQVTKVYRNDNGVFTDINASLMGVSHSSSARGDYDNDGDLDILISGSTEINQNMVGITKIYNNNNGIFTDINAGIIGLYSGGVKWFDYNNDGDLDIVCFGRNNTENPTFKIYRNDNGVFSDINANLTPEGVTSVSIGDYDNDGDLDILMTGSYRFSPAAFSTLYRNDNGTFVNAQAGLQQVSGTTDWGDYDRDGDLDIFLSGSNGGYPSTNYTKIYRNEGTPLNTIPTTPTNLRATLIGDYINFQWNPSSDAQTPQNGLNYSLRIGTTSGGNDILSCLASSTGLRKTSKRGYVNSNCSWKIKLSSFNQSQGYYWGVQAVDGCYAGSAFAESNIIFTPKISLLTPTVLTYNTVINENSDWQAIRFKSIGIQNIVIDSIHFLNTISLFEYTLPSNMTLAPGASDSILVRFSPITNGTQIDTIYIETNSEGNPILKIILIGNAIEIPPDTPENLTITQVGFDMQLDWDAVTTDIHDNPIIPDGYLVFYNASVTNNEDDYYYLWRVTNTTFTHYMVGQFSPRMLYKVRAYKSYSRDTLNRLDSLNGTRQKLRYEVLRLD